MKRKRNGAEPKYKMITVPIEGEVGAGTVVEFIPRNQTATVAVPVGMREKDVGTVVARGPSLTKLGIHDGDLLHYNRRFNKRDCMFEAVCIVYIIPTAELIAKKVVFGESGTITLKSSGGSVKDKTYAAEDIEIRGVVFSFQRMLRK